MGLVGPPDQDGRGLVKLPGSEPLILSSPEVSLCASFDAILGRLGVVPKIAAETDNMRIIRLLAPVGAGPAVIPPISADDEIGTGVLAELVWSDGIIQGFFAVTGQPRIPNPLVVEVLSAFELDEFWIVIGLGERLRIALRPHQQFP